MFKPLKYDRLKKIINDKEEKFIIETDIYNSQTGEYEVKESMIDPDQFSERKQLLQKEIDKISDLLDNINKGDFEIADKRNENAK